MGGRMLAGSWCSSHSTRDGNKSSAATEQLMKGMRKPVAMSLYRLGTHTSDSSIFYMFGLVGQAPVSRLPGHRPAMALETDCHERTDHRR
jgi:hypothetical protein